MLKKKQLKIAAKGKKSLAKSRYGSFYIKNYGK